MRPAPADDLPVHAFPSRWLWPATLVFLGALAMVVRWPGLTARGFWFDELLTAEFVAGFDDRTRELPYNEPIRPAPDYTDLAAAAPPWAIWWNLHATVHPPIYYIAVRLWVDVFGTSDRAFRSLSAVCGAINVMLLGLLVARRTDRPAGAFAAALLALSATQIFFSHEARHYILATTFVLLAAWAADTPRLGKYQRPILAVFLLLIPLTHYFAVGAGFAVALWAMLDTPRGKRRRLAVWYAGTALVFAGLWGPQLWQQLHDGFRTTSWMAHLSDPVPEVALHLARLPLSMLIYERLLSWPVLAMSWSLWLVPVVIAWRYRDRRNLLWLLWFPLALLPAILAELVTGQIVLFYPRYVMFAAPGLCGTLATVFHAARSPALRRWRYAIPAAAVLMTAIELTRPYSQWWPDHRPFATYLAEHVRDGDGFVVVRSPSYERNTHALYRAISHYVLDGPGAELWIMDGEQPRPRTDRVWVVAPLDGEEAAPVGYVKRYQEGFPPTASVALFERAGE